MLSSTNVFRCRKGKEKADELILLLKQARPHSFVTPSYYFINPCAHFYIYIRLGLCLFGHKTGLHF